MPFKRLFKDKYAGSLPENASVVRILFDLLDAPSHLYMRSCPSVRRSIRQSLCWYVVQPQTGKNKEFIMHMVAHFLSSVKIKMEPRAFDPTFSELTSPSSLNANMFSS